MRILLILLILVSANAHAQFELKKLTVVGSNGQTYTCAIQDMVITNLGEVRTKIACPIPGASPDCEADVSCETIRLKREAD